MDERMRMFHQIKDQRRRRSILSIGAIRRSQSEPDAEETKTSKLLISSTLSPPTKIIYSDNTRPLKLLIEESDSIKAHQTCVSRGDEVTLILLGKVGHGKSATGNSILGKKEFLSRASMNAATTKCKMASSKLKDGRTINVIDTPGLCNRSVAMEETERQIVKYFDNGIHAVILVFSVRSRFKKGEQQMIERLKMLLGKRIVNYIVVVFTGGDNLKIKKTLAKHISRAPRPIQEFIYNCSNRVLLFTNEMADSETKELQLEQLLAYVNAISATQGGRPYYNEDSDVNFNADKVDNLKSSYEQATAQKKLVFREYNTQHDRLFGMALPAPSVGDICRMRTYVEKAQKEIGESDQEARCVIL